MKTISDSIFNGDDCFFLKTSGSELGRENAFIVKGWGVLLCASGSCGVNINTEDFDISSGCEIILFPDANVKFYDCSEDLSMQILSCSDEMMSQALRKVSPEFFTHIRRYPVYKHAGGSESITLAYLEVLRNIYCDKVNRFRRIIATNIVCCLMLNIYDKILSLPSREGGVRVEICRAQEIYGKFRHLLQDCVMAHHDVAFYAEKLCITARYLASVTSSISSRSPKEEIDECLLREARIMLTFSKLSIQQISDKLHFPDPSHFGRFFKRMTGITPLAYRKTGMVM